MALFPIRWRPAEILIPSVVCIVPVPASDSSIRPTACRDPVTMFAPQQSALSDLPVRCHKLAHNMTQANAVRHALSRGTPDDLPALTDCSQTTGHHSMTEPALRFARPTRKPADRWCTLTKARRQQELKRVRPSLEIQVHAATLLSRRSGTTTPFRQWRHVAGRGVDSPCCS